MNRKLGGPQNRSGRNGDEKYICPCRNRILTYYYYYYVLCKVKISRPFFEFINTFWLRYLNRCLLSLQNNYMCLRHSLCFLLQVGQVESAGFGLRFFYTRLECNVALLTEHNCCKSCHINCSPLRGPYFVGSHWNIVLCRHTRLLCHQHLTLSFSQCQTVATDCELHTTVSV